MSMKRWAREEKQGLKETLAISGTAEAMLSHAGYF